MSHNTILSDNELIILLKDGEKSAYTEIYKRYWAILFSHARKMLRNDDEAKDVVQDVFAALWVRISELNLEGSLSSYLYSAVRYKIFDLIDKNKVRGNYFTSLEKFIKEGDYTTDNVIREKELAAQIEEEIAMLPLKMRQVFELSRKSNLSHKEIASKMHISHQTVKKQIHNAIKILRPKFSIYILFILYLFSN